MSFIIVLSLLCLANMAQAASVEIIANGKKYASLEEYKQKSHAGLEPAESTSQEMEDITKTASQMGIAVNPSQVKTFVLAPKVPKVQGLSPEIQNKINQINVDGNLGRIVADFTQTWDKPQAVFNIDEQDLPNRLEALAEGRTQPVLVISKPHHMRVMSYAPQSDNLLDAQ